MHHARVLLFVPAELVRSVPSGLPAKHVRPPCGRRPPTAAAGEVHLHQGGTGRNAHRCRGHCVACRCVRVPEIAFVPLFRSASSASLQPRVACACMNWWWGDWCGLRMGCTVGQVAFSFCGFFCGMCRCSPWGRCGHRAWCGHGGGAGSLGPHCHQRRSWGSCNHRRADRMLLQRQLQLLW